MIIVNSKVLHNSELASNIWKLTFGSSEIANDYLGAGQFVSVLANESWEHPIRRPMSIAEVKDANISLIYKIFGPVTKLLSNLKEGDNINTLGPLGNTFNVEYEKYHPILIGGGIGLSPIYNLSTCLSQKGVLATTIYGARNNSEHFLKHTPKDNLFLCTDDGSIGIKGNAIDALEIVINNINNPMIFACGPELMLAALQKYSIAKAIPAQFSVESYMACGVGFCQGCVIPNNSNNYQLVCKSGPVFDASEVKFD